MNRLVLMLALFAALLGCHARRAPAQAAAPAPTPPPTVLTARAAFERYDPAASRRLYETLEADPQSSPEVRSTAALALATQDWRFDLDAASAIRRLDRSLLRDGVRAPLLVYRGRVRLQTGQVQAAQDDAAQAIAASTVAGDLADARLLAAEVSLALTDKAELARAVDQVEAVLAVTPGRPEACEALLGLSLRRDDGPGLLRAFRCYFFIAEEGSINGALQPSHDALVGLASTWSGRPLTLPERRTLVTALTRAGFHDHAVEIASLLRESDPELRELRAYHQFLVRVRAINADFYPRAAKGLRDYEDAYDRAVEQAARTLWVEVGSPPPADASLEEFFDGFFDLLRSRFRVEGYLGSTMGFYGMLAGHVIHDERRQVDQHGHTAEFRYVSLDRLLSRDFTSWYGTTNVGGWGTETTMFQVRAAYTGEPFQRLAWVTDPAAKERVRSELATLEQEDLLRTAGDPYAHPRSVGLRLRLIESERLYGTLRQSGRTDAALAFVAESLRLNVEATVFAHEGRHALDQRYRKDAFDAMSDEERELRAKYSEVTFSSNPRLALTGSILGAADESTGHGKANRRFRKLLVDWMRQHPSEIPGLDPARPHVMQLHLLSDGQLLKIVKAVDRL